jgi:uncharacterized protein (DUF2141 family)
MNRRVTAIACASLAMFLSLPATAQTATVTLVVEDVPSASGSILAKLCGDVKAPFPGRSMTHIAKANAEASATALKE